MNRIVINKEQNGYHPQKDTSFDILSLVNQLHRSKSTQSQGPERGKVYFSKNQVPDLMKQRLEHLLKAIKAYKKVVRNDIVDIGDKAAALLDNIGANKAADDLFRQA